MRRRYLAIGAALISLLAGCSSGHHAATPSTTSTTSSSPNPDVVPADITPAYVDAVFAVLNHINGDAVRSLLTAGRLTSSVTADLGAIYGPPLYSVEAKVFQAGLSQNTSNLRRPPGDRLTRVLSVITANPSCIFVKTASDLSSVELHPTVTPASEYWELQTKAQGEDPSHINPTPWVLTFNADYRTSTDLPSTC